MKSRRRNLKLGGSKATDGRAVRGEAASRARREQVLAAARRVFSDRGYHATSIADLIGAAGIARGTFYLHFVGKRAIFDELVDGFFVLLAQRVRVVDVRPGAAPAAMQLAEICRHILGTLMANADLTHILLHEAAGVDEAFDGKLGEFYGRILDLIQHALDTGSRIGLVRGGATRPRAHMMLGTVKELVAWLLLRAKAGQLVDLDDAVTNLLDFNMAGVSPVVPAS